ncbi:MAG: sigma-70 family RNA polymerase sigma factor [Candidatus Omnitrophica bacterium]|nr:sigma-70 family RNA polymerase sigma factor [Candidatus Omnitrophota bacterium]
MEKRAPQREDDKELICLCQGGDRAAFERLYRRYAQDVYTMAMRIVRSVELAEEVTQEVFISLYRDIQKFQFQSAFTTWLYRIVYRRSADQFRKIRKHKDHTVPLMPDDVNGARYEAVESGANPADQAIENEQQEMLEKAMDSLTPKQRAILILRYTHHLSYEEIAHVLRCRIGTVKSRLNRAHKMMQEKLNQLEFF